MPTRRKYATQAERQAAYRRRLAASREKELAARGVPPLPAVATLPGHRRWQALIQQAQRLLQTVEEEMEESYDQRSESWQESARGEAFQERLQALQEAHRAMEDLAGG